VSGKASTIMPFKIFFDGICVFMRESVGRPTGQISTSRQISRRP